MTSAGQRILLHIFSSTYSAGMESVPFSRDDIRKAAGEIGVSVPKNLGAPIYDYRSHATIPEIESTAPDGKKWVIRSKASDRYAFELASWSYTDFDQTLLTTEIPDATPEIILAASRNDEQALLAKIRYNRLADIFLGLTTYSLQSHLRTNLPNGAQAEVDEVYVAIGSDGKQYIIPVEAKGERERIGIVQVEQSLAVCEMKWPGYTPIAIGVQPLSDDCIAMFKFGFSEGGSSGEVKKIGERHYRLASHAAAN
ncbi:hypothetical protein JS530_01955 [Bifidobacterium sp. LC6]|uniref:Endonuclease n=1 Tax=Bifidobacterium colobi TaxID=2809026 RepID=A0ABS5UTB2_9BIFI|nr:hypothetical protein [Bifidobacterium colobi]MBT1174285.1 hypothetical protein [Bifidobacterium colobi]